MKTLKEGAKGSDVKKLQMALNKVKAKPKLKVTGTFCAQTTEAVKYFQKKSKLKVDGLAGENTVAALKTGGKKLRWKVRDVTRAIKQLHQKSEDTSKDWIELATLMGKHHDNKDLKFAYRNYKIWEKTYSDYLRTFRKELEKIEELKYDFTKTYRGKPAEQEHAQNEAKEIFKKAMKMNKIADKLKRRYDTEHDRFLEVLDMVPA